MATSRRGRKVDHPGVTWRQNIEESGLTQAEVARRMGVSQKHLNKIVNGHAVPTATASVAFAEAVEVDAAAVWKRATDYLLALALAGRDGQAPRL